ncbi:hypothetical protein [Tychonema sp. LEGE 07203]|uniref:hypothetical protein n=1 Tax=Tychonema sp. LEGE 07203 TaxID=1828671 RepID=UPI00351BF3EC
MVRSVYFGSTILKKSLVIGYWSLVIGYWLWVIGYWLLVISYTKSGLRIILMNQSALGPTLFL